MGQFDVIIGPMLVGTILNVFLLGIMVQQCHVYFVSYPKDRTWIKMMVAFVLCMDVANSAFDAAFTYDYTITKFGKISEIYKTEWVFSTEPITTVILSSTAQLFYAWRVRKLTGKMWLGLTINICVCIQFLGGIGAAIGCAVVREFVQFQKFQVIVTVWLVMASLIDISIAAILVWYLRRHKTSFADTDDLITRTIRLAVQTGAVTAVWSIIVLVIYLACQNTLHLIFGIPLSKLYTVSLMSSLNARRQKSEVSNERLIGSPCTQETSDTSSVLIICRHAPSFDPSSTLRTTPSSVSNVDHLPTFGLEWSRVDSSPMDIGSANQDGFTQDIADTKISHVNWYEV